MEMAYTIVGSLIIVIGFVYAIWDEYFNKK